MLTALAVLAGNDHSIHTHGLVVLVVLHSDLALAVRTQIIQLAVLAHLGQALGQLVGQTDGHGHQLRGLIAGIAEHHALIACTAHLIVGAPCDVGALAVDVGDDGTGIGVKAELCAGVADICHHLADDLLEIDIAVGGDLAHDVDKAGGCAGLAGHAGIGVVGQDLVQNGIGDLVADLVGMSFGDGLRSKQTMSCHLFCLLIFYSRVCISCSNIPFTASFCAKNKSAQSPKALSVCTLISRFPAGFGTLRVIRTGCRASQGLSPQPLLISRYSVGTCEYSIIASSDCQERVSLYFIHSSEF